jgi:hypothetical protein
LRFASVAVSDTFDRGRRLQRSDDFWLVVTTMVWFAASSVMVVSTFPLTTPRKFTFNPSTLSNTPIPWELTLEKLKSFAVVSGTTTT